MAMPAESIAYSQRGAAEHALDGLRTTRPGCGFEAYVVRAVTDCPGCGQARWIMMHPDTIEKPIECLTCGTQVILTF